MTRQQFFLTSALLVAVSVSARPGAEPSSEAAQDGQQDREVRAQMLIDGSVPPSQLESNVQDDAHKSEGASDFISEAKIPVQLVYGEEGNESINKPKKTDDPQALDMDRSSRNNRVLFRPLSREPSDTSQQDIAEWFKDGRRSSKDEQPQPVSLAVDLKGDISERRVEPALMHEGAFSRSAVEAIDNGDSSSFDADLINRNLGIEGRQTSLGPKVIYGLPPLSFNPNLNNNPIFNNVNSLGLEKISPSVNLGNLAEAENSEHTGGIRRRIQHYQSIIQPTSNMVPGNFPMPLFDSTALGGISVTLPQDGKTSMLANMPVGQRNVVSTVTFYPAIISVVTTMGSQGEVTAVVPDTRQSTQTKVFDDYFPFVVNNPFNSMWTALTNIVEYGPEADVCRKAHNERVSRHGRRIRPFRPQSTVAPPVKAESPRADVVGPRITRLRVRKGGVAIAGPGGIATAGSGGTAIVGPGGTAYTSAEGVAIAGPGGKVMHVPDFTAFVATKDGHKVPAGARLVATGPVVYYDPPVHS